MKVYSIFSGSALVATALLSCSLILSARTLSAETLPSQTQQQTTKPTQTIGEAATPVALEVSSKGTIGEKIAIEEVYIVPPTT